MNVIRGVFNVKWDYGSISQAMRYKTNLFSILESASVELQMVVKSFPSHYHRFQTKSFYSQEHHGTPPSWYFGLCSLNQLRYTETVCYLNILGIVTNNHAEVEAFSMANKKVISHETWKFEPKKRPFQVPLKSGLKSMVSALECNFQNFYFKNQSDGSLSLIFWAKQAFYCRIQRKP